MIIQFFRSKKLPKILEIWQIREKTKSFTIFRLFFFFKFTRLLSIKNKYVYILEKINQWLFKVLEAKNDQFSLKFSKFAKKRQVLQCRPALIFSIFWKLKNITFNSAMQLKIPNINRVFRRSSKPAEHFCDF